jgi:mannose-6-phosphate isomerase-like protein (cupin superfamily)
MNDGDALFFDGRLWHGSENQRAEGARTALLFQYVAAGNPVKMPDFGQLEWPFQFKHSRVPALLVSGSDSTRTNYVVPPPVPRVTPLVSQFHPLKLPLPEDRVRRWRPQHLFAGMTPNVLRMSAHVSVLSPGYSPHAPHAHSEEEILIVLDGEAEVIIAHSESGSDARHERLRAGSFVYYPAFQFHTIHNPTAAPITYLMFKWTGPPRESEAPLKTTLNKTGHIARTIEVPFAAEVLFEGPTHYLAKLHAHITELQPGAGYAHHADDHDVAIAVLSGMVETMSHRMESHSVVYFPAREMHDMKNPGPEMGRYVVFEFHGSSAEEPTGPLATVPRQLSLWKQGYRAYWRLRRRFAGTALWQMLRPIYRRIR